MTFPKPVEWACSNCTWTNTSGPSATRLLDGGETWKLVCFNCATSYPVAVISAKGVRLRHRLQATASPAKRAKLTEQLQAEVTRPA